MSAKSRALIYVGMVFFIGAIGGAFSMHLAEHYWLHPQQVAAAPTNWEAERSGAIEQFRKQLNLTDDQSKQLEGILDETMRQYEDLHSYTHHIRDDGLLRIRTLLDDNQKKQFDVLTRRVETPEQRTKRREDETRQKQAQQKK